MSTRPPWIHAASNLFCDEVKQQIQTDKSKKYQNHKWRKASASYFKGKPCAWNGCLTLAELTDHINPVESGGSMWDRRNWQPLCNKHHAIKRGKERNGKIDEKVGTPYGYIPKSMEAEKPDIVGQSYMIRE